MRRGAKLLPVTVAVLGLVATLGFAYRAIHITGVFWADVQVRFLAPSSQYYPNVFVNSPSGMVMAAGAVQKMVDTNTAPRVNDPNSTLASQGIRHGYSISLPNTGGQWASNFTDPVLDVQAVGSTPAEALSTVRRLVGKVDRALVALQRDAGVDRFNKITTQLSPPTGPSLYYETGSRSRAAFGVLLLGTTLTMLALQAIRRLYRRRTATQT